MVSLPPVYLPPMTSMSSWMNPHGVHYVGAVADPIAQNIAQQLYGAPLAWSAPTTYPNASSVQPGYFQPVNWPLASPSPLITLPRPLSAQFTPPIRPFQQATPSLPGLQPASRTLSPPPATTHKETIKEGLSRLTQENTITSLAAFIRGLCLTALPALVLAGTTLLTSKANWYKRVAQSALVLAIVLAMGGGTSILWNFRKQSKQVLNAMNPLPMLRGEQKLPGKLG